MQSGAILSCSAWQWHFSVGRLLYQDYYNQQLKIAIRRNGVAFSQFLITFNQIINIEKSNKTQYRLLIII